MGIFFGVQIPKIFETTTGTSSQVLSNKESSKVVKVEGLYQQTPSIRRSDRS